MLYVCNPKTSHEDVEQYNSSVHDLKYIRYYNIPNYIRHRIYILHHNIILTYLLVTAE